VAKAASVSLAESSSCPEWEEKSLVDQPGLLRGLLPRGTGLAPYRQVDQREDGNAYRQSSRMATIAGRTPATVASMRVSCDYVGWDPAEPLDPEAECLLSYLDRLATSPRLSDVGEVVALIDEYGVVRAEIPVGTTTKVFLQAGDDWDRVLWTCPSGRVHEWPWDERSAPEKLEALLSGRGVERTTLFRNRRLGVRLVVDGRTLATTEGGFRLALLRRLGISLPERDEPAL
jgi:hypothetical protein